MRIKYTITLCLLLAFSGPAQSQESSPVPGKKEKEKIKISRYAASSADTIRYVTVISLGGDSVKAVRVIPITKGVPNSIPDTTEIQSSGSDQLELDAGWGGNYVDGIYDTPPNRSFLIDRLVIEDIRWQPIDNKRKDDPRFPLLIIYDINERSFFVWLDKEDIVYPADAETALVKLQQLAKRR